MLFSFFYLLACSGESTKTNPDTGKITIDEDGDGFLAEEDCDDSNASISPSATEICDGMDNNCNGTIDEDVKTTYYADADEDGFGNEGLTVESCSEQDGFVDNGSDCNDTDNTVFPGAEEICDGLDNNCNEDIDEGLMQEFYLDEDGDGFGDLNQPVQECALRLGISLFSDDCNDTDADIHPLATEICDDIDNNCTGTIDEGLRIVFYEDKDSDGFGTEDNTMESCSAPEGFVAQAGDCDDLETYANPFSIEICDEIDNDCDGYIDEDGAYGTQIFFADTDEDGFGDPLSPTAACSLPTGHSQNDNDCDDTNSNTYWGADETCDGADNDCDGTIDENDASDAPTWYIDYDGDGYGSALFTMTSCMQPASYVANTDDCDDTNASVYVSQDEICDGLDNDCDGQTDEEDAIDMSTWYLDNDEDGYGDETESQMGCNQPIGYVSIAEDCNDQDNSVNPGIAEVWYDGIDSDCDGESDYDQDQDGWRNNDPTNPDCNDEDSTVNPGIAEVWYDGIDSDCDGESDYDQDQDGYDSFDQIGGADCDDADASFFLCGSQVSVPMESCLSIIESNTSAPSDIYWIDPQMDGNAFEAYCDMTSYGGGWMLVLKSAPYYDDSSWTQSGGYATVHDDHHISPAYMEISDFTEVMSTYHNAIGDVSHCWTGSSLFDVIQNSTDCTPTQIDSEPLVASLTINATQGHNGCSNIRARIGFNFHTWDGGVSGTWMGIGKYGYKTNNTVFGTSCVFQHRPWPSAHQSSGDFYIR
ncbi:MAG: hypothetical protein CL916_13610 [Deltaproteobacteria bacterium]|nr:hypothetical protein [Deltaproteobacteria bacterium]